MHFVSGTQVLYIARRAGQAFGSLRNADFAQAQAQTTTRIISYIGAITCVCTRPHSHSVAFELELALILPPLRT
jgi:hypothetical protein